ncbi:MAG: MobA/MobL family protein [Lachnoclostridium sp.]|nr:MobA/MobL family protein [Lachnoclostridium sp.]
MAIYHLTVKIIGRSSGRSSVASAAYRAGVKLKNENDGITHNYSHRNHANRNTIASAAYRSGERLTHTDGRTHDFTVKKGIVHSEIMLPEHAPHKLSDRSTLWNEVEKAEKQRNAQLAREVEIALPNELDEEQQIDLVRDYIDENFVSQGMCADFSIHAGHKHTDENEDKDEPIKKDNPHVHIMLTMRPLNEDGTWGAKSKKEYIHDRRGNRIKGKSGEWKSRKVNTTDWNEKETLLKWRENWADICNERLAENGYDEQIDHRTLEEQGFEREPTIHVGHDEDKARQNREIIRRNERFLPESVAERMNKLQDRYTEVEKELQEHAEKRREIQRLDYKAKEMSERANQVRDQYGREYFRRIYGIEPEQAGKEIQRLKAQYEDLKHEWQDKIQTLTDEKHRIEQEYQKQKLIIQSRPDREDILCRLKHHTQLERITEDNNKKIANEMNPSQRKILANMQRNTKIRMYDRVY